MRGVCTEEDTNIAKALLVIAAAGSGMVVADVVGAGVGLSAGMLGLYLQEKNSDNACGSEYIFIELGAGLLGGVLAGTFGAMIGVSSVFAGVSLLEAVFSD